MSLDPLSPLPPGPAGPVGIDTRARSETPDGLRVATLAAEFEAMLLQQMLREMRASGSWKAEGDGEGLGAEALFESLDVELASHLATTGGFGLAKVLRPALEPLIATGTAVSAVSTASLPVVTPESSGSPSAGGEPIVTSRFGWRPDPFHGGAAFHRGVDVRAAYGEAVSAAAAGTVVFAGEQGGYGQTVVLQHADGLRTRYAHLSAVLVNPGDRIEAGADLGLAGRSGRATGTHLHFEVTRDGRAVNPADAGLSPLKPRPRVADVRVARDPSSNGRPS